MSSHPQARLPRLLVLSLVIALVACEERPRATQVVVTISATGTVANALTAIEVEVYDPELSPAYGERRPTGARSFALADQEASNFVTLPFSFGIPMTAKPRFLLVVKGYSGDALAIEQKALVAFRPRRTIAVRIDLVTACLKASCTRNEEADGWLESTCLPEEGGRCGQVPEREGVIIDPGAEDLRFGRADDPAMMGERDAAIDEPEADGGVATPEGEEDSGVIVSAPLHADAGSIEAGLELVDANGCTLEGGCSGSIRCGPGQVVAGTTGERCSDCETGTFSSDGTAVTCTPWRDCAAGTYVVQEPDSTQDRVCAACAAGTTSQLANQGMCLPLGSCHPGSVQTAPATATTAATCRACSAGEYCAGGTSDVVACGASWDHDGNPATACVARAGCAAGQYVTAEGSATTNRACAPCPSGSFSAQANERVCSPWAMCGAGFQERVAGSSTANRVCRAVPWTRQFGTSVFDGVAAVSLDPVGNVYVAGSTSGTFSLQTDYGNGDAYVRKYDITGNEVWTRQFGTAGGDNVLDARTDRAGNVYLVGRTTGVLPGQTSLGPEDAFIRKYDTNGNEQWTRQYGTFQSDTLEAVGLDANGNVFVAGFSSGALPNQRSFGDYDGVLRKYDTNGVELWTRQFGTTVIDWPTTLAVDGAGNAYVAGYTHGALTGSNFGANDCFVRKYDTNGTELWTRQFGSTNSERIYAARADASGVYVGGYTVEALPGQTGAGGADAFVRKYDPTGRELWTRQFGTSDTDDVFSIDVDSHGAVYVAGSTGGALPGQLNAGQTDGYVRRYESNGTEGWILQFGTSAGDGASSVAVDQYGTVFVAGSTSGILPGQFNQGSADGYVTKYVAP